MALPLGIETFTATFGPYQDLITGDAVGGVTVTFTPVLPQVNGKTPQIVHLPTGRVLLSRATSILTDDSGAQGTVVLPCCDATGLSVTNFSYLMRVSFPRPSSGDSYPSIPDRVIQVLKANADQVIDLDELADIVTVNGTVVSVPTVQSVAGLTGVVTLAQLQGAGLGGGSATVADGSITVAKLNFDVATQAELDALSSSITTALGTKVNSSTYTTGLAAKLDVTAASATYVAQPGSAGSAGQAYVRGATPGSSTLIDLPAGPTGPQGAPGLVQRGTYSNAATYAANDAVAYNGSTFRATAGTTGVTPGTVTAPNSPWIVVARSGDTTSPSVLSAAMADELPLTPAPTVTLTASTTSSYTSPNSVTAVVSGALNPLLRANINDTAVSGTFIVPTQVAASGGATGSGDQAQALQIDFDCDDSSLELDLGFTSTTGAFFRLWVNEMQSITYGPPAATGRQLVKVDFGSRGYRRISLEIDAQTQFYGVKTSTDGTILNTSNHGALKLAAVGDSYLHGDGYNTTSQAARSYFTTMARSLGFAHYRRYAASGTGLVNAGAFGTYQQRVAQIVAYAPDVLLVQGSQNDNGQSGIQAAATTFIQAIQSALPNCQIIVTGVLRSFVVQAADVTVNTALQAASAATGVAYIDASTWFTGTGQVTSPNNSGNSDYYNAQYLSGHPSPAGHIYLGRQLARQIAKTLGRPAAIASAPAGQVALQLARSAGGMSPVSVGEETLPRLIAGNNGVTLTSGSLFIVYFTAAKSETISKIITATGGTTAAGGTKSRVGVYTADRTTGALTSLLASSAVGTTDRWNVGYQNGAGGINTTLTLSAAWQKQAGTDYALGFLFVGTTAPQLLGALLMAGAGDGGFAPRISGVATSQTDLPSTLTAGSISTTGFALHAVMAP